MWDKSCQKCGHGAEHHEVVVSHYGAWVLSCKFDTGEEDENGHTRCDCFRTIQDEGKKVD